MEEKQIKWQDIENKKLWFERYQRTKTLGDLIDNLDK